jgi:hypothetical protein
MLRFEQHKHADTTSDSIGTVVYTLQLSNDTLSIDILHIFLRFLYSGCIAPVDAVDTYTLMELASIADEFLVSFRRNRYILCCQLLLMLSCNLLHYLCRVCTATSSR